MSPQSVLTGNLPFTYLWLTGRELCIIKQPQARLAITSGRSLAGRYQSQGGALFHRLAQSPPKFIRRSSKSLRPDALSRLFDDSQLGSSTRVVRGVEEITSNTEAHTGGVKVDAGAGPKLPRQ